MSEPAWRPRQITLRDCRGTSFIEISTSTERNWVMDCEEASAVMKTLTDPRLNVQPEGTA